MYVLPVLNAREKKRINQLLEEQWGFARKLDHVYLLTAKNRLFFVNQDIERLNLQGLRVSSVGVYVGELLQERELRLSIEGSQLVGHHATKNVVALDALQARLWLKGQDLDMKTESNAFVILKHGDDFLGCGKAKDGRIINFVPKTRRILAAD